MCSADAGVEEIRTPIGAGWPTPAAVLRLHRLVRQIFPRWLDGEKVLIRSGKGLNQAPLLVVLLMARAGRDVSIAVQYIRDVHTPFAFYDDQTLAWLMTHSRHALMFSHNDEDFNQNLRVLELITEILHDRSLSADELRWMEEEVIVMYRATRKGTTATDSCRAGLDPLLRPQLLWAVGLVCAPRR